MFGFDLLPKASVQSPESMVHNGGFRVLIMTAGDPAWKSIKGPIAENDAAFVLDQSGIVDLLSALLQDRQDILYDYRRGRIRFAPIGRNRFVLALAA